MFLVSTLLCYGFSYDKDRFKKLNKIKADQEFYAFMACVFLT